MALISPKECEDTPEIKHCIDEIISLPDNPIQTVYYLDVRESMRNGGGPACLRLRVPLTQEEWEEVNPRFQFSDTLYFQLKEWIQRFYREQLSPADLADSALLDEARQALDALTQILQTGPLYEFQQN